MGTTLSFGRDAGEGNELPCCASRGDAPGVARPESPAKGPGAGPEVARRRGAGTFRVRRPFRCRAPKSLNPLDTPRRIGMPNPSVAQRRQAARPGLAVAVFAPVAYTQAPSLARARTPR